MGQKSFFLLDKGALARGQVHQPGGNHGEGQKPGPVVKTSKDAGIPAFVEKGDSQYEDQETDADADYWVLW